MPKAGVTHDILVPQGHARAVSTGTSDVQTITLPAHVTMIYLRAETNGVRFTLDGSTPDATNGMPLATTDAPLMIPIRGGRQVRFVSQVAGNGILHVIYFE